MDDDDNATRRHFLSGLGAASLLPKFQGVTNSKFGDLSGNTFPTDQPTTTSREGSIVLENNRLSVKIDTSNGGISQITDKISNTNFRDPSVEPLAWVLELYSEEYDYFRGHSGNAEFVDIQTDSSENQASVSLSWNNPQVIADTGSDEAPADPFEGTITLTASLTAGEAFTRWTGEVDSNDNRKIRTFGFPLVTGLKPISGGEEDSVVIPKRMGRRINNPANNLDSTPDVEYPSGSATMQFTAYTGSENGLYFDTRDTEGYQKKFSWRPINEGTIQLLIQHLQPREPRETVSVSYDTTLGVISGDWQDAVNRYTRWLKTKGWLSDVAPDQPDWIANTGLTFKETSYWRESWEERINETDQSHKEAFQNAKDLQEFLKVPFNYYEAGWQTHGFPGDGDWMPPKEGEEGLKDLINSATENGMPFTAFYNPTGISKESDLYANRPDSVKRWAKRSENGDFRIQKPGNENAEIGIEVTQSGYKQRVINNTVKLAELGSREIQIDGLPWSLGTHCFSRDHNHPEGPGNWYPQRIRDLFATLSNRVTEIHSENALSGEGITDFLLPYQDIGNSRDVKIEVEGAVAGKNSYIDVIPAFQYGLDDHASIRFQNGEDPLKISLTPKDLNRIYWTRTLIWGAIPWISIPQDPTSDVVYEDLLSYIGEIASARTTYGQRFINTGTLLRTPKFQTEQFLIESEDYGDLEFSRIWGSSWGSDRGEVAILLTNGSPEEASTTLKLSDQHIDLPTSGVVYEVRNGKYRKLSGSESNPDMINVNLQPNDITLYVFTNKRVNQAEAVEEIVKAQKKAFADEEVVAEAKRAFERGNFAKSIKISQSLTDTTPTESPSDTSPVTTSEPTQNQETPEQSESATSRPSDISSSTPGFGVGSALGGLIGGTALMKWLENDESESDR